MMHGEISVYKDTETSHQLRSQLYRDWTFTSNFNLKEPRCDALASPHTVELKGFEPDYCWDLRFLDHICHRLILW